MLALKSESISILKALIDDDCSAVIYTMFSRNNLQNLVFLLFWCRTIIKWDENLHITFPQYKMYNLRKAKI